MNLREKIANLLWFHRLSTSRIYTREELSTDERHRLLDENDKHFLNLIFETLAEHCEGGESGSK